MSSTAAPVCASDVPTLQTGSGPICGISQESGGQTANTYLGVPYAQPPVEQNRWAPPQPAPSWTDVRSTTALTPSCPAPATPVTASGYIGAEDCLYLNIWTPSSPSTSPKNIMVYIPGGGFMVGGGNLPGYNGTYMAASSDTIVINMSYRLGALGYLRYTDNSAGIEGNFGIQDQLAALRWIKANAAALGGDPARITLFGESAGAESTALHLFSIPKSKDLFRAAIMESNTAALIFPGPAEAATDGAAFVDILCNYQTRPGCPKSAAWLRSLPLETVMTAQNTQTPATGLTGLLVAGVEPGAIAFQPTVGVEPIVNQTLSGFGKDSQPKPFVMGHNQNEGGFFVPQPLLTTTATYTQWLQNMLGKKGAKQVLTYSNAGSKPYNPASYTFDAASGMTPASQALMRAITDFVVASANIYTFEAAAPQMKAAGLPMFGFEFTQVATFNYQGLPQCSPQSLNVCHSFEIPFVFSNFVARNEQGIQTPVQGTPAETALATKMTAAWTGFAHNPNSATGWGQPELNSAETGPYVNWNQNAGSINDMGSRVNYKLWKPLLQEALQTAGQ